MTDDGHGLEDAVRRALAEVAPEPSPSLASDIAQRIAATQQEGPEPVRPAPTSWRRWTTMVLGFAGILAGVVVGLSAGRLIADPVGSQDAAAPSAIARSASPSGPPPAASASPAPVSEPHDADAHWTRMDLPDPVPGVFGGGIPTDLLKFENGYAVAGTVQAHCASDLHLPPDGCTDALSELSIGGGPFTSAVVWVSGDGRTWEVVETAAFEGGRILDAATDGSRIVAVGDIRDVSADLRGPGRPAVWTSSDARSWRLIEPDGPVPEMVAWTPHGWVGVRNARTLAGTMYVDASPEFLFSEDGVSWQVVGPPEESPVGHVEALAVDTAGASVVAVGYTETLSVDGLLETATALSWRTENGREWEPAPEQDSLTSDRLPGGVYMQAVTPTADGWLAVGRADDVADSDGNGGVGVWISSDGLVWTRLASMNPAMAGADTVTDVVWTNPGFVATGTIGGEHGSVVAAWLSGDGAAWLPVRRQTGLEDGTPISVLADGDTVITVGARSSAPDHWLAVVYVTSR